MYIEQFGSYHCIKGQGAPGQCNRRTRAVIEYSTSTNIVSPKMIVEIILFLFAVFLCIYRYVTKDFDHFKKLEIPYKTPSFPFGTIRDVILKKTHTKEIDLVDYQKFSSEKFYGFFQFGKPVLSICDPEVARDVLVKDFNHFVDTLHIDHTLEGFKEGGDLDKVILT